MYISKLNMRVHINVNIDLKNLQSSFLDPCKNSTICNLLDHVLSALINRKCNLTLLTFKSIRSYNENNAPG